MSRSHSRRYRFLLTSLCAAALLLLPPKLACGQPAAATASDSPPSDVVPRGKRGLIRQIKYGDWQKFCFKAPGSDQVCRTSISGNFDTGQLAIRADLIEREGKGSPRLQLFLPVGMYLPAGVKVNIDQGERHQLPYVWCLTNVCIAADVADPALIRQMEMGQQLKLEVVDSNLLSVSTTLSLGQFASAHNAAASQTFRQDVDE
jgi:invasion protein IalB